jgi:hypothetical protein
MSVPDRQTGLVTAAREASGRVPLVSFAPFVRRFS